MTTVEAPATHLRENPYELAQQQLRVADIFDIDQNLISVLKECKKAVVGLDPDLDGRRHRSRSSRATASRTTSRAGRPRAGSATTRTSRSTRSRRSRCG